MILKSELKKEDVSKALETIAAWCYFSRCDSCPLHQKEFSHSATLCALIAHIPSEYRGYWMYEVKAPEEKTT